MRRYEKRADGTYPPEAVEECLQQALADAAMEGLHCTDEEIGLMRACLLGEVSRKQFLEQARELARKAVGR